MPQLPQFCGSVCTSVHVPLQVVASGEQMQNPPEQTSYVSQKWPQLPQLNSSVFVSVQVPLQLTWPDGQLVHTPFWQTW